MSGKVWVVAGREYRVSVRSKSFVVAILLMPVFMFGGIGVQLLMEDRVDTDTKQVAVVDRSGKLFETLATAAEQYNAQEVYRSRMDRNTSAGQETSGSAAPRKQVRSKIALQQVAPAKDREAQRLELSDRVRNKELFAIIEIGADILNPEGGADPGIMYYSNSPTYEDIQRWLRRVVSDRVREVRLAQAGIDQKLVERAMTPPSIESLGLVTRGEGGKVESAKQVNQLQTFMVPFGLVMLMWVAVMMATQPLLHGAIEEKMQRISEVLLGSVRPFDLMLGKLIGFVGMALTLIGVYSIGIYFVARHFDALDLVPIAMLGWFVVYLSLAILMFGSLFLAVGACCNDLREAQNLVMPIMLVMVLPLMALGTVLRFPSSQFSTVLSLIPFATPMVMMVRQAVPPGVPIWQPMVGVIGTLLTTLLCVWAAGRIFRVGLLMQGKPPKLTDLAKWAIRG
ncbi:MAG: ABC transporter permease [Phycisphaerae bacterium]|nr:MAG: ABC transporter permease [Planctomycetia bacterium]RIK69138.1 MAG: hypothetical protein DCC66_09060 [Planctomycetota bacterium]GJQ26076.1 MAG: ABC transporter permease [Phycisphaerae bacterium]